MRMRAPIVAEASCLGGCCDNKMVEQETGTSWHEDRTATIGYPTSVPINKTSLIP